MAQSVILLAVAILLVVALALSLKRRFDAACTRNEPTISHLVGAIDQLREAVTRLHSAWESDRRQRQQHVALPVTSSKQTDRPAKRKTAKAR